MPDDKTIINFLFTIIGGIVTLAGKQLIELFLHKAKNQEDNEQNFRESLEKTIARMEEQIKNRDTRTATLEERVRNLFEEQQKLIEENTQLTLKLQRTNDELQITNARLAAEVEKNKNLSSRIKELEQQLQHKNGV